MNDDNKNNNNREQKTHVLLYIHLITIDIHIILHIHFSPFINIHFLRNTPPKKSNFLWDPHQQLTHFNKPRIHRRFNKMSNL